MYDIKLGSRKQSRLNFLLFTLPKEMFFYKCIFFYFSKIKFRRNLHISLIFVNIKFAK